MFFYPLCGAGRCSAMPISSLVDPRPPPRPFPRTTAKRRITDYRVHMQDLLRHIDTACRWLCRQRHHYRAHADVLSLAGRARAHPR